MISGSNKPSTLINKNYSVIKQEWEEEKRNPKHERKDTKENEGKKAGNINR